MKQLQYVILALLVSTAAYAAEAPATGTHPWHQVATGQTPFAWSGLYFGVQAGGGWGNETWAVTGGAVDLTTDGVLGGAHVGVNWQADSNWVLGVEGELDAAGINGKVDRSGSRYKSDINWVGLVTGRIGRAVNSALIYAKGGAAFVDEDYSTGTGSGSCSAPPGVQCAAINAQASSTRMGWTVGAGAEWAFAPRWSARVEYNYVDTGSKNVTFNAGGSANIKQTLHLLEFGLSYKLQ